MDTAAAIAVDDLSLSFDSGAPVLADVSLHVGEGEFVSLVGPSGCGKTTLLILCAGLVRHTGSGRISVGGRAPLEGDPRIGYMLARDSLLPWRTALARTFALDSMLLLMNEPFGALDAQTKLQLEDLLLRLCQQHRHTVLFVTHDLAVAVAPPDHVVVMSSRPGRIVADVPISLPRPRSIRELQKDPAFMRSRRSCGGILNRAGCAIKAEVTHITRSVLLHGVFLTLVLGLAELASARCWIDPTFFGQPSGVARFLWLNRGTARLWVDLGRTLAGIWGVSQDHVTLCRTLGAKPSTLFFQVTLRGAVPVIFSSLRLGLIYSLLGVIGAKIIASERGLGQTLAYLGTTFDINGVMALLLLATLGGLIMRGMTWLEKRLLHWQ